MASKKILCQFDVQAVTSLSNPGAGYVGFSAKTDGLYQKIGAAADLRLLTTADSTSYQPIDADLTAIAGLGGVLGFLVKTNTNTWVLDTSTYALSTHTHAGAYAALAGSLTQAFNAASLTIEAGTYDWLISGSGGVLTFTNPAPASSNIQFLNGFIISNGPTANTIACIDSGNGLNSLDTGTYPSLTELSYLKGISGAINTTYAKVAGSATQAFDCSQINIEAGTYPFQIKKSGSDLVFTQYSGTAATFSSANGITTPGIILSGETSSTLAYFDAAKKVKTLPTASYPSLTEIAYVKGVTSAIQTQITARALLAGATTQAFSTANLSVTGTIVATSTIKGTYGIFTGLTDNRVPYHVNDTIGLNDSGISADGSNMTINGGKIRLKTLTDPTHHLYNNTTDYDAINVSTGFMVEAYNGGTPLTVFTVTAAGVGTLTGAFTASEVYRSSSRELKYDIQDFKQSAMCIINKTKIMSYRMKSDYSFSIGFIAEDTHPWLSGEEKKGHIFGNHLAILTKAVQEEDQKILQLQRQVIELQNQIKEIQDGRGQ